MSIQTYDSKTELNYDDGLLGPGISSELEKIVFSNLNIDLVSERKVGYSTIYHYTSPDGLLGILQNETPILWFTKYDSLNDCNERKDILDFVRRYCINKTKNGEMHQKFADLIMGIQLPDINLFAYDDVMPTTIGEDGFAESYTRFINTPCDVYLCCFSTDPDSLAMWNYYSKSTHYEGYNLGFHAFNLEYQQDLRTGHTLEVRRVIYHDDEKTSLFDEFLSPFNDYFPKANQKEIQFIQSEIQTFIDTYQFLFKHSAFEHEKEVRAILKVPRKTLPNCEPLKKRFRNSNGYIVPYIPFPMPKSALTDITIAPMLQTDIAEKNIKELLSEYQYPDDICVNSSSIPIRF